VSTIAQRSDKRRPFDPATRKKRAKKVYDTAPAKGRDANRFDWYDAFREANLPLAAKALGFTLSTYGNRFGDRNFPGLARLATNLGLDERTVRTNLTLLETAGWIRKTSDYAQGPNRIYADVYQLTIPDTFVSSKPPKVDPEMPEWAHEPEPTEDEPEEVDWIPETGSLDTGIQPTSHLSNNKDTSSAALRAAPGRQAHGIIAGATTEKVSHKSPTPPRVMSPPKTLKTSKVAPTERADCDHLISLIPHVDEETLYEALRVLRVVQIGTWKWGHDKMRQHFKEPSGNDAQYGDPETLEKARVMYAKALRCTSASGTWHECLTDPLDAAEGA